ncbi:MAG: SIR2 family protein [Nitrososphaera sp.]|nr:SIR2 family protein [Nitrososphaera sp.]
MSEVLPLGLRHALESGECVLFVGAGIGVHLFTADGKCLPDAASLAKELAQEFSIETSEPHDLAKIAQVVQLRKGRPELEAFLRKRLGNLEPDDTLKWLFSLRWRAIFTTNYDLGIQRTYELIPDPPQRPVTISTTSELVSFDARFEIPIYHLHGTLFGTARPHIIITEEDYARFRESRRMLFEILKKEFATASLLYVGYSNRDPNWKMVLEEIRAEFYPSPFPQSYRVAPSTDPLDNEILKSRGIETIGVALDHFVRAASAALSDLKVDPDRLQKLQATVPKALMSAFEKNPAATARFLLSWTYVNEAPFDAAPNTTAFLRGDRPNWSLVGRRLHFERDIEDQVYEDLLDYATSERQKPGVVIVLGPAGYGVTTLLMSVAARLVNERAGPLFMHKPGAAVIEGDIEFAISVFTERPFFIVDFAADHSGPLRSVVHKLGQSGRAAVFLLGERLNEWRQNGGVRLSGREHNLEALSEPEIIRLIQCLEQHGELGQLRDLNRDLQIAAIKQKHGKELLVVLRESTEGKGFDAIIEDEFLGIKDELSRQLYAITCCFYQHGALARDTLLAELLGLPLADLYRETKNATEGVVVYECVDESYGHYVARARHRIIAQIVWNRCVIASERERLVASTLAALNLNYKADRDAFNDFIRSDALVESIVSFEGKVKFFEVACRKDPMNPYVRQHYARMLSRDEKPELALGQIDEALRVNPNVRILYHTKGIVLRQLAMSIESPDIARRRLAQSEEAFRRGLSMFERDEYCYTGLAELYFGWAKRGTSPEEVATYIGKAEETINEGLKVVRTRDSLWVVSSEVQKWLGNQPQHLQSLERAVAENPGGIVARYLLGRAYRRQGDPQKTVEVLHSVIRDHPNEFRSCVEYACALMDLGEAYAKCIAVLRLSTLHGLSDPRFIATLGGMLFMNREFSEADRIFSESYRREFPATELQKVQFRPRKPGGPERQLELVGKVVGVKAGYAFIEVPGYPPFFCPGSKFGGVVMKYGLEVVFEPAFSARGALAERPRPYHDEGGVRAQIGQGTDSVSGKGGGEGQVELPLI